jgi:hypothetical protein
MEQILVGVRGPNSGFHVMTKPIRAITQSRLQILFTTWKRKSSSRPMNVCDAGSRSGIHSPADRAQSSANQLCRSGEECLLEVNFSQLVAFRRPLMEGVAMLYRQHVVK